MAKQFLWVSTINVNKQCLLILEKPRSENEMCWPKNMKTVYPLLPQLQERGCQHQCICKTWSNSINLFPRYWVETRLTITKGHNCVVYSWKLMCHNPNLDLVNVNAYPKFGLIPSIHSQDIEHYGQCICKIWSNSINSGRNKKFDNNQGP